MQVILMERIAKLGNMGDEVNVRPGYARNFLLPQRKAVRATGQNRQRFEAERTNLEAANQERRAAAKERAGDMTGMAVVLIRQAGESGQLYGSVTARDIADSISEQGFAVRRQQVELAHPIKSLGIHSVAVALHPEVTETVTVNVARSSDEAEIQARSGRAVLGFDADEEEEYVDQDAAEVFEPGALDETVESMSGEEAEGAAENRV